MPKKLIEVALPLEAINRESAREKTLRHGLPSTLHLWWARRPLAACRAALFASLIDDPSEHPDRFPDAEAVGHERQRLFSLIEKLAVWENMSDEAFLSRVRDEARLSSPSRPALVLDPFCGGGAIPLEAQRLGLQVVGSDLNPVAVLITKAMVEIAPRFWGLSPASPELPSPIAGATGWEGLSGLAADIRRYGDWLRREAWTRIGHLYPTVEGRTVIAWIWARTIRCPNPGCGMRMPLIRSLRLSSKAGKFWKLSPEADKSAGRIRFKVVLDDVAPIEGSVSRAGARCMSCGAPVPLDYVRQEAKAGRMGVQLVAMALEGERRRGYAEGNAHQEEVAASAIPAWEPSEELPERALGFRVQAYGMKRYADLFTRRQLTALVTFCDLLTLTRDRIVRDANARGLVTAARKSVSADEYGTAVATFLAFAIDRSADYGSTICTWHSGPKMEAIRNTFARQAIPMTWDFAEVNPFSASSGNWMNNVAWIAEAVEHLPGHGHAIIKQLDATASVEGQGPYLVCTDPPYYDNIGYADLSDFFYVWLRRAIGKQYPDLFSTVLTPKRQELVASPYRFGGDKSKAEEFFRVGLRSCFSHLLERCDPAYPLSIFYAYRQTESEDSPDVDGHPLASSTGWDSMLDALISAGFMITGTWPMRSELGNRPVARGTNALAYSIILVCRARPAAAALGTRREFLSTLRAELRTAVLALQRSNIAPVDLAQAAIGPGMAVFSRYSSVIEADGRAMSTRAALQAINDELDLILSSDETELDPETRWAVLWFSEHGMGEGAFGRAENLSKAKNTSLQALTAAGIASAIGGKVRLLKRTELEARWEPRAGNVQVWLCTQQLLRALESVGIAAAAELLVALGPGRSDDARALAYRLYAIAERRKWADEAASYNGLVTEWAAILERGAALSSQSRLNI